MCPCENMYSKNCNLLDFHLCVAVKFWQNANLNFLLKKICQIKGDNTGKIYESSTDLWSKQYIPIFLFILGGDFFSDNGLRTFEDILTLPNPKGY